MKEDAAAKDLEHLLRDALNTGLDTPRGGTPLLQLKTVPLQVQHLPKGQQKKPQASAADAAPNSTPRLAEKLAPDSVRPPAKAGATAGGDKKRSSLVALLSVGAFALAAAGGAAWLARDRQATPVASTATVVTTTPNNEQGAVGIAVTSRPAEGAAAPADAPKVAEPPVVAATPPPPPTFNTVPAPVPAAKETKPEAKAEAKPEPKPEAKVEAKPKHEPRPHTAAPAPKAEARPAEKTAAAEKKEAPAPAATPAGSVDALLQQQLKGAIP